MNCSSPSLLRVSQLLKRYPSGFQFGPANFTLSAASTYAFLGINGAGKSTLFQLLTGNLDASEGQIYWREQKFGPESFAIKRHIGYLPQNLDLPPWVSGLELLTYAANLYATSTDRCALQNLLEYWDCQAFAQRPLAACSHGMQKRLALALASFHNPQLLILDEPFSGLDLLHIRALEKLIQTRQEQGLTTVLSTHIAHYVAKLCQAVYLIKVGQVYPLANWQQKDLTGKIQMIEDQFF